MVLYLSLYISSCHKAHKALTFSFHPLRFAAKALTVVHDCHPATRLSSSTILLHVVFGRPGLLLPSGLHSNAVTQCSSLFFLNICPIQFHLRRLISSLVLFTPVVSCNKMRGYPQFSFWISITIVKIYLSRTVASWLVCSTSDRVFRVRGLAGDIVLCSWARHFTLTVLLFTQVYKWVPA